MNSIHKTIRFQDSILQDVDAFAGKHKLKDIADGSYDFSQALHLRYAELLQKEKDLDNARSDAASWKGYATVQEKTSKGFCEPLNMTVTPDECRVCAEKHLQPKCPKTKPLEGGPKPA